MRNVCIVILSLFAFMMLSAGCAKKVEEPKDKRVLAKINDYELTVDDFKDEARRTMSTRAIARDPVKTKRLILEDIIIKKVLLQEAQKEHFDKDKEFMKEIERYWEQALLKLLVIRKQKELSERIEISSDEVRGDYDRLSRKVLAEMIILKERKAALQLSVTTEDINTVKEELKENIVTIEAPRWWSSGEMPLYIEQAMFALKSGESTTPIKLGDEWLVIRVLDERSADVESLDKMAFLVRNTIMRRKNELALKVWMDQLRKQAQVKVNEKVFEEIDID